MAPHLLCLPQEVLDVIYSYTLNSETSMILVTTNAEGACIVRWVGTDRSRMLTAGGAIRSCRKLYDDLLALVQTKVPVRLCHRLGQYPHHIDRALHQLRQLHRERLTKLKLSWQLSKLDCVKGVRLVTSHLPSLRIMSFEILESLPPVLGVPSGGALRPFKHRMMEVADVLKATNSHSLIEGHVRAVWGRYISLEYENRSGKLVDLDLRLGIGRLCVNFFRCTEKQPQSLSEAVQLDSSILVSCLTMLSLICTDLRCRAQVSA
jgi:hypothetical protein